MQLNDAIYPWLQVLAVACIFSVGLVVGYGGARRGVSKKMGTLGEFPVRSRLGPCDKAAGQWLPWMPNDHSERRKRFIDKLIQSVSRDRLEAWLW